MATRRPRVSIEQRRRQILDAALLEFSHKGLHGGSTVTIAKDVGISHPNLFRVFATKRELFVAVLEDAFATVERDMMAPGERADGEPIETMAGAWGVLMERRELMLIMVQGYAAAADPVIRDVMHAWTREMFDRTEAIAGVGTDTAHDFLAAGFLYMIATTMDLPARADTDDWVRRFLDSGF